MKKKVKKIRSFIVTGNMRLSLKGSYGDNQIKKELVKAGFDVSRMIYQSIDYKNLNTIYQQEYEAEVEDFEIIDYNRYEYYLNIILEEYILNNTYIFNSGIHQIKFDGGTNISNNFIYPKSS